MKNNVIHLTGHITAVQPYTSATPGMKPETKNGPMPVTKLKNGNDYVLAMLSSSIKGGLRRAAADLGMIYHQERDGVEKPLTLNDHKFNRIGGVKGKGDSDRVKPQEFDEIQKSHPLIALFGSGQPFLSGLLTIESAYASHAIPQVVDGVRSNDFIRNPELLSTLSSEDITEFLKDTGDTAESSKIKADIKALYSKRSKSSDQGAIDKTNKDIDDLNVKLTALNKVSTQLPLPGYESIPADTSLSHNIKLRQKNDDLVNFGFFLTTLDYFSYSPLLGGKISNGCGEVAMKYTVTRTGYGQDTEELGEITLNPYHGVELSGDYLKSALSAYQDAAKEGSFEFKDLASA